MTDQQFDGDGYRAKSVLRRYDDTTDQWVTDKITYYLTSSVLGTVVDEVSDQGTKERAFVLSDGGVLAIQDAQDGEVVNWQHYDASSAGYRKTDATGAESGPGAEMDPRGADAGLFKPITWPPPTSPGKLEPYYGIPDLNSGTQGCVVDNVPMPCEMASAGGTVQCENNQGSRYNANLRNGLGGFENFRATAEGLSGYLPIDAVDRGGNNYLSPSNGSIENELSGNFHLGSTRRDDLPQDYSHQRQDLKGDKDLKPPQINVTNEGLTACVKQYLSRFFDRKLLDRIIIHRDELPAIVPGKDDTGAYTANENEIWFNKGQYSPNSERGIGRIGHEVEHAYQWNKYGGAFALLYLGDSVGVFYQTGQSDFAYELNRFEISARKKEKQILDDIAKNGNPCP